MFKTDREWVGDSISSQIGKAEDNYTIQKNDYLGLSVYSSGGERIIDPDFELSKGGQAQTNFEKPRYLVRNDGYSNFPMIGDVKLEGLTLNKADSVLSIAYSKYYNKPFVVTKLLNKRVTVLGPLGGKLIPLENENLNLIEIIGLYGGINEFGKAYNIKLIRGDLNNPTVRIIDLSTIEGMRKADLDVQPNDIIYIETQRKFISDTVRDIAPIVSIITGLLVAIYVVMGKR